MKVFVIKGGKIQTYMALCEKAVWFRILPCPTFQHIHGVGDSVWMDSVEN